MRDFTHSLPMALLRAREAVMSRFRPLLKAHNITEQQWRLLRALDDDDGLEISELARRCCFLLPSVSGIVRRLESRSLLRRASDRADQRRAKVFLTAKARRLIAKIAPQSEQRYRAIERTLGGSKLNALYDALFELESELK